MRITVVYYHEGATIRMDNDNMLKPIQDALNGHIYVDDRLIVETSVSKKPVDDPYRVRRMSRVLADAFVEGREFVYALVEPAPVGGQLP